MTKTNKPAGMTDDEFFDTLDGLPERDQWMVGAAHAEHVLINFERKYPNDGRPRKAIEAKRAFARGEISREELDKALDAALSASCAAIPKSATGSIDYKAWSAASSAARSVVRSAGSAAGPGEREWQKRHLIEFLAAKAPKPKTHNDLIDAVDDAAEDATLDNLVPLPTEQDKLRERIALILLGNNNHVIDRGEGMISVEEYRAPDEIIKEADFLARKLLAMRGGAK